MFKYFVLLGALAFAAPGLAIADGNQPPSFPNDPPDSSFNNSPLPPGLGGTVPACSVLAADPDDANGSNGDDKNPTHGNKHCHLSPASR